jgi:preprotein translocase subunit SecD
MLRLLAPLALALAAAQAAPEPPPPAEKQAEFATEVRLALDKERFAAKKVRSGAEKQLEEALKGRLALLGSTEGRVEVKSPEDIRVVVKSEKVDPTQLRTFTRIGRWELRHLDEVQTSLNPDGRVQIDVRNIQDADGTQSVTRFRDRKSGALIPADRFFSQCPILATNADFNLGAARAVSGGALMAVRVQLTLPASKKLRRFLQKPGRVVGMTLDGEVVGLNVVGTPPKRRKGDPELGPEEIDILGGFATPEDCGYLAVILNAPPLPFPIKVLGTKLIAE